METKELELRKLKSEIEKLKELVNTWNNPESKVIGLNEVCGLLSLTRPQVRKLASEEKIPSHQFSNGKLYFIEDELINSLKN